MINIPLTLVVTVGAVLYSLFDIYEAWKTRALNKALSDLSKGMGFERLFSLKRNTLIWLVAIVPMAWMGAIWFLDIGIACIVLVWFAGRLILARRDVADMKAYWLGIWLQIIALFALALSSYVIFVFWRAYFG